MKKAYVIGVLYGVSIFPLGYYQGNGRWGVERTAQKHQSIDEAADAVTEAGKHIPDSADEVVIVECTED